VKNLVLLYLMKKQTIIVTGASSAIGREIARHFLKNGDNVVLNSPNAELLNQVFYELGAGENLAMVAGNTNNRVTGIKILATAVAKFGSVDVLVNNADIFATRSFLHANEAYLDRFLETNLKGTYFTTQAIIPQMLNQRDGVVINIGSPLEDQHPKGATAFAPLDTKGALHSLTIQLIAEFGKHNIRFNTISPGTIRSGMHINTEDRVAGLHLLTPKDQLNDIAQMVFTIAKSKYITGAVINVDGAQTAGYGPV
jgi:NAD(P)-dependent dehydrogenase (short-subunit alcohol dehydrogenase family)